LFILWYFRNLKFNVRNIPELFCLWMLCMLKCVIYAFVIRVMCARHYLYW
jgi:hypothetical protein